MVTTLEFCEMMCATTTFEQSIYDTGLYDSFCSVMGQNPLLWWLPIGVPMGDGMDFTKRQDPGEEADTYRASEMNDRFSPAERVGTEHAHGSPRDESEEDCDRDETSSQSIAEDFLLWR